jgi:hypothetical protein
LMDGIGRVAPYSIHQNQVGLTIEGI